MLTREHGKVRAVAKGVRRTSSKFGSRLEPFSHIDVQFAEGRGQLEVVTQAETLHPALLGLDYSRFTAGQVLVETAERLVAEDGVPSLPQYRLLLGALLALGRDEIDPQAIVDSYLLRALATAGYAIVLEGCVGCGVTDGLGWFSPQAGGVVCASCRPPSSATVDTVTIALLGGLLQGDWERVAAAAARDMNRAHGLTSAFATWHLERGLRSLPFLER